MVHFKNSKYYEQKYPLKFPGYGKNWIDCDYLSFYSYF